MFFFRKAMAEGTGPNDARHVVWAIIKFFYYYFYVLLILTIIYIDITHVFNGSGKAGDKNRPKQCNWCHLGPFHHPPSLNP